MVCDEPGRPPPHRFRLLGPVRHISVLRFGEISKVNVEGRKREHVRPAYVVVTVAYRSRLLLTEMLQRIPPPTPIIVVDNSADDEDITDVVQARPMTTYIDAGGNIGFGAACNLAASVASQP